MKKRIVMASGIIKKSYGSGCEKCRMPWRGDFELDPDEGQGDFSFGSVEGLKAGKRCKVIVEMEA